MNSLNKLILLINNNPANSGVGRYAFSLYSQLRKMVGTQVGLISWDQQLFGRAFRMFRPLRLEWAYYIIMLKLLARKLGNKNFLVHITNAGYLSSIIPEVKRKSKLLIITVHDLIPYIMPRGTSDTLVRKHMKKVKFADYLICPSENTKRDLSRFMVFDSGKVKIVYHGVDHDLFRPRDKLEARKKLRLPLDKPMILNVGSEEPRKNIPTLLNAFKKLLSDAPDTLLVRVGERTAGIENLIKTLGLSGKVLYRRASANELAYYYNAGDMLVHPSFYEGFGNPPLEAMASGIPVIAGNRASIPEVVGDSGILLDPFDIDGFAYWMREVLTNEDLRIKLSEAGYRRSLNFSWEKCAKETLEVYKEVLGEA